MALAAPYSRSSGWAATARARDQSLGEGEEFGGLFGHGEAYRIADGWGWGAVMAKGRMGGVWC